MTLADACTRLVPGPRLRYVADEEATMGVEADRACAVELSAAHPGVLRQRCGIAGEPARLAHREV